MPRQSTRAAVSAWPRTRCSVATAQHGIVPTERTIGFDAKTAVEGGQCAEGPATATSALVMNAPNHPCTTLPSSATIKRGWGRRGGVERVLVAWARSSPARLKERWTLVVVLAEEPAIVSLSEVDH